MKSGQEERMECHRGAIGLSDGLEVDPSAVCLGHAQQIASYLALSLGDRLAMVNDRSRGVIVGEVIEIAGIVVSARPSLR